MTDNYDDRKFDEAMRTQMRQQLGESICTVKFKKADDTEREMNVQLMIDLSLKKNCLKAIKQIMIWIYL